jgi:GNAT superfamily N-acetyltransferase
VSSEFAGAELLAAFRLDTRKQTPQPHDRFVSEHVIREIRHVDVLAASTAVDLLAEYEQECSIPLIGRTNPQADIYANLETLGLMQVFGVYAGDELVGFASVLFTTLPHYGKKVATMESLFVSKPHRSGAIGNRLLHTVEDYAQRAGCVAIQYCAPTGSAFDKLLSLRATCIRTNSVFTRRLA